MKKNRRKWSKSMLKMGKNCKKLIKNHENWLKIGEN